MNGVLDICENALSPLRGLLYLHPGPTAHAVGYSLALLRSFLCERLLTFGAPSGAERRQIVAHGVSHGAAACMYREPRRGDTIAAFDRN